MSSFEEFVHFIRTSTHATPSQLVLLSINSQERKIP